jgi:hypothetical protein
VLERPVLEGPLARVAGEAFIGLELCPHGFSNEAGVPGCIPEFLGLSFSHRHAVINLSLLAYLRNRFYLFASFLRRNAQAALYPLNRSGPMGSDYCSGSFDVVRLEGRIFLARKAHLG